MADKLITAYHWLRRHGFSSPAAWRMAKDTYGVKV